MKHTIKYPNEDFETVFNKIGDLEKKVKYWELKSGKKVNLKTCYSYNIKDNFWEGIITVEDVKKSK